MDTKILKSFVPLVKELWQCDDEGLQQTANDIMTSLGSHPDLLGEDDVELLIQHFLDSKDPNIIGIIFLTRY